MIFLNKLKPDRNIGENIRDLRIKNKLTQEQVVAQLQILGCTNITRNIYSRYEMNALNIRVSELIGMTKVFNCSFNDFFRDIEI